MRAALALALLSACAAARAAAMSDPCTGYFFATNNPTVVMHAATGSCYHTYDTGLHAPQDCPSLGATQVRGFRKDCRNLMTLQDALESLAAGKHAIGGPVCCPASWMQLRNRPPGSPPSSEVCGGGRERGSVQAAHDERV